MRTKFLAAVCFAGLAPALYADYQASFRNGITAIDRRKWAEATAAMRSAIAENPTESSKKIFIYGTRYVEYTPYFYLGLALSRSNNCGDAVPALRTSAQQNVIKRTAGYKELKQMLAACGATEVVERDEPAPAPIVVPSVPDPSPAITQPAPTPAPEIKVPPAPVDTVRPPVPSNNASLPADSTPITPAQKPDPALAAARQRLATLVTDGRRLLDAPRADRSAASRDKLKRAVDAATRLPDSSSPQAVQSAALTLTRATEDFRAALNATPGQAERQLAAAVRAYVSGDYTKTTTLLEGVAFDAPKARAQAALFRAAARYALFRLDGEKDTGLRTQAIADLRQYRRIEKTPPDVRLFSPPFQQLYAEVR